MTNDQVSRLEALRIALQIREGEMPAGMATIAQGFPVSRGKTAEKLIADATKIHAFLNVPTQRKRK